MPTVSLFAENQIIMNKPITLTIDKEIENSKYRIIKTCTMKRIAILLVFAFGAIFSTTAQDTNDPTTGISTAPTDHSWEVGLHGGHFFSAGNIDFTPGYAGGIHFRRALDYVFSLRLDLMYGQANGEDEGNTRGFTNTWYSGSLQGIASLNNLKWNLGERKTNLYALAGVGVNGFEADLTRNGEPTDEKTENEVVGHGEIGAGIGFRINNRVNIGLEHKAMFIFGKRGDLVDVVSTITNSEDRSTFRDVLNYTSVRLNFNLGNPATHMEPLYWLNPLDAVLADIDKLKDARVTFNDSDGDGVIDMLDEEEDTPEGAAVSAKGIALDSDGDGLRDYEDKEPYSPPQYTTNSEGVAEVPNVMDDVEKMIDEKLKNFQPKTETPPATSTISYWYMPTIYFGLDSYTIQDNDYGTLANVAEMIKSNPNMKFVVIGHTDQTGSEEYNTRLSYQRAKAVIDHLTENGKVDRGSLILNYRGEASNLAEGRHRINRRVEFRVASNETEMTEPAGSSSGN